MEAKAEYFFEVSWEVCNKVGGIFTVVSSKAAQLLNYYHEKYFLIGPYFPKKAYGIFEEKLAPDDLKEIFERLKNEGIECHYGTWLIKGNPNAILVEFTNFTNKKDEIKKQLWDYYQIDSLNTQYFDFDEPVVWSRAVARLLEEMAGLYKNKKIAAQFHEWLAASALLFLKHNQIKIGTVFTTHATTLGRTLANTNRDLYGIWDKINPDEEAGKYGPGTSAKHQLEKQAAKNADVFTTVSEITAMEAEHLLKKKVDVILPNGLNMEKFPTLEENSIRHRLFKSKIHDFLLYYFFPYYTFDLDNTLVYFLCGRYEFHDKGIDIFIKALAKLNNRMKEEKIDKTVVAFLWVPGNIRGIKPELLENKTLYEDIKDSIDDNADDVKHRLVHALVAQKPISKELLFSEDLLDDFKRKVMRFLKTGAPPIATHDLYNEGNDLIYSSLMAEGLDNQKDDKVKVIYYPIYLTGADNLLNTSYYESMQGSHLGVFPSYYEPWGYTPLEGGALAVPAITTDLAGFGRFICKECKQGKNPGIFVIKRLDRNDEDVTNDLADTLYYYTKLSSKDRIENKIAAREIANMADWKIFVQNYINAHNKAVKKVFKG